MPSGIPSQESQQNAQSDQEQTKSELPPFYSPKIAPVPDTPIHNDPLDNVDILSTIRHNAQLRSRLDQDPTGLSNSSSGIATPLGRLPPPPSLLSPAFTPPATPGIATPLGSESGYAPTPSALRGIPVDSTSTSGGCGNNQPRLLETLPEVTCLVRGRIPTRMGTEWYMYVYSNSVDNKEHLALVRGDHIRSKTLDAIQPGEPEFERIKRGAYVGRLEPGRTTSAASTTTGARPPTSGTGHRELPLVRVHSECYTGETAWSARCDCGEQLDEAERVMSLPQNQGGGIIVYLRQEGRGIGLVEKLKAYNLQDLGADTVEANMLLRHPADARTYGLATAILMDLGQTEIRLMTNNPDKIRAVEGPNREVVIRERVEMKPLSWKGDGGFKSKELEAYLRTKIEKMGHMLAMP